MRINKIKVIAASIRGPLHLHKGLPCQDYYRHSRTGKNFVAIVSDGAGSAKFGKIGAKTVCDTLIDILKNAPFSEIKSYIHHAIKTAREKLERHRLNKTKNESGIMDFSATVVGAVYHKNKGVFFHIGDGAALAFKDEEFEKFTLSPPQNGSFSCETFFYTQPEWEQNLRFTPFENADTIFLMSDGLTNFSFLQDFKLIDKGFILPIHRFLRETDNVLKAQRALINTLNNGDARRLNSDDKTLLWARL